MPRKIFEQTYGSETLTSQAVDEVVPEVYAKAVREHDLEPVERPEDRDSRGDRRPPDATSRRRSRSARDRARHDYKGVKVDAPARSPSPTRTSNAASRRSPRSGQRWCRSSGPPGSATSSRSTTRARSDGQPFEGGTARRRDRRARRGAIHSGLRRPASSGCSAGESKNGSRPSFPDGLPGGRARRQRRATFTITLTELKELELPPLDDAFAGAGLGKRDRRASCATTCAAGSRRSLRARGRRATGNAVMSQLLARPRLSAARIAGRRRARPPGRGRRPQAAQDEAPPREVALPCGRSRVARQGRTADRSRSRRPRRSPQRPPTWRPNSKCSRAVTVSPSLEFVRRWATICFRSWTASCETRRSTSSSTTPRSWRRRNLMLRVVVTGDAWDI